MPKAGRPSSGRPAPQPKISTTVPYPKGTPRNVSLLLDRLIEMFGFGDYDEVENDPMAKPYWEWRIAETSKLKRSLTARKVAHQDLYVAALYARAHHIYPMNFTWLYKYVVPGLRWWQQEEVRRMAEQFDEVYQRAVDWEARNDPDGEWYMRLVRATDREAVLKEWRDSRVPGAL